jgi:hypothetical protein
MHMLKVEYLLKISRMSDVHIPTSGPLFSTSIQPQAHRIFIWKNMERGAFQQRHYAIFN